MELRMLGRRSLSGSVTVVGDIAQATGEWAPRSWDDVLAHLPTRRGSRVVELTVNYRTPSEIMELASRVLTVAAPSLQAPESVRSTGISPRVASAPDVPSLADIVAQLAREEAAIVSGETAAGGTVAVISPPSLLDQMGEALGRAGLTFGSTAAGALDDTITLIPVASAKGLEFDSVIVVEPARIVAESAQGLRALYVAMTRTTRRLAIAHADRLPEPLEMLSGRTQSVS
jgi:DNA helicase IV